MSRRSESAGGKSVPLHLCSNSFRQSFFATRLRNRLPDLDKRVDLPPSDSFCVRVCR
jgi:hypothetical protein